MSRIYSFRQPRTVRTTGWFGTLLVVALILAAIAWLAPKSFANTADFKMVDFVAAAPFTYNHSTGGGAYDDRTVGEEKDVTEQLEGGQFACGDIVTYLLAIQMEASVNDPVQTAEFDLGFLGNSTGQSGVALGDIVGVSINYGMVEGGDGPGGTDSFIMDDGGSEAILVSETLTGPLFQAGTDLLATVQVTDLEAGEQVVLRIDVRLFCNPLSSPTGNLQARVDEGRVVGDGVINIGAQTVPFLKVGDIMGANEPLLVVEKTVTTADGTCGVDDVEELMIFDGDTVKYCYVVRNPGTQHLFDVELIDDNGTPGDPGDDFVVTLTGLADLDGQGDLGDLAAGGVATGQALVTISGTTKVVNTVTATGNNGLRGGNFEELTASDDATVIVEERPVGMLSISKSVTTAAGTCPGTDSITITAGEAVKYCYVVTNTGTGNVLDVSVLDDNATPGDPGDDFPVTLTGLTDEDGDGVADDLAPGASATGEVVITLGSAGTFTNVAVASGTDEGSGDTTEDSDDATVTSEPPARGELVIEKTVTTADGSCPGSNSLTVFAGDTVKYCFAVSNPGTGAVLNVSVVDDNATPGNPGDDFLVPLSGLSDEDGDGSADDLAPGAVATGEVLKTITGTGTFTNTATASGTDEGSGESVSDSDGATVTADPAPGGALAVAKTVTTADGTCPGTDSLMVVAGDTVKYCFIVTNPGDGAVLNVTLVDDNATPGNPGDDFMVPLAGLTDEDGDGFADDLAPGASASGEVLKTISGTGTFTNTATASGTDERSGDPISDSDSATVTASEVVRGELRVVKTVTTADGTCPGSESITTPAGTTVKYCYEVFNIGNGAVLDITLVDDHGTPGDSSDDFVVPLSGLADADGDGSADDLGAGGNAWGEVLVTLPDAGTVVNVATATGTDQSSGDPVSGSDDATVVVEPSDIGPCLDNPLGLAGGFNVFVFGDLNQSNTDATGRVAAGGNATLTNFGVGLQLPNSNGTRDDLIVGGNLNYTNGNVYAGNVVYGGTGTLMNVTIFNGTARQDSPINFTAEQSFLKGASASWGGLPANGTTTVQPWGGIYLTGTNPEINVFTLPGAALASATYFEINAPAGSTVLVNIDGDVNQMQNFGFSLVGGVTRENVLFNFFETTQLTLQGIGVQGTILAPCADILFNNGDVNGSIIGETLTGYGESHHFPFTGCLPAP